jgi:hypothetical protein
LFRKPALNGGHRKKFTNESKGQPKQKFNAAFGTTFRISKCFQRSKQKLHVDFSLGLSRLKNLKTICACQESTDLIL